jgi:octaprenyl-diphosphate synthase
VRRAIEAGNGEDFAGVLAIVRESGALDAARDHGIREADAAKKALSVLPNSNFKETLIEFADFAVRRQY